MATAGGEDAPFRAGGGSSNKFWEVDVDGAALSVRFGRIGTNGQTKTKTFTDNAAAQREYDKLVKEKTGKGYAEVGTAANANAAADPAANANPAAASAAPVATPKASSATASGLASSPPPTDAAPASAAPPAPPAPIAPAATTIEWPQAGFE